MSETTRHTCPELKLHPVTEGCYPGPSGIGSSIVLRFCGQRKNLRGVKRRVGDVWQLPKGYVCYTPMGWMQMEDIKTVVHKAIVTKGKEE